jgi:hypothetical protein
MEAVLLVAALTAISMAMIALHDLLTGPMSWWRKVVWSLLVLSLPPGRPDIVLPARRQTRNETQATDDVDGEERQVAAAEHQPDLGLRLVRPAAAHFSSLRGAGSDLGLEPQACANSPLIPPRVARKDVGSPKLAPLASQVRGRFARDGAKRR